MSALSQDRIAALLEPYLAGEPLQHQLSGQVQAYVDLLLKWNLRTNLTAIRDPEDLVRRQVGESLFAARMIPASGTLLDFGSGAGFPGMPIAMVRADLRVTLAESQGKKASFLREAVRSLGLPCEVWAKRVEDLPAYRTFDCVILRAVDATSMMLPIAAARVAPGGSLVRFTQAAFTRASAESGGDIADQGGWSVEDSLQVPGSVGHLTRWVRSA